MKNKDHSLDMVRMLALYNLILIYNYNVSKKLLKLDLAPVEVNIVFLWVNQYSNR